MRKILIVDDEPMMAKMAVRGLKDAYETVTAASGAEALALFESDHPDLVISDIKMPGMSGFDLCSTVKEKYGKGIPFIFMTADESEEGESRGADVGAAAFIRKPVRGDVILAAVTAAFEGGADDPSPVAASPFVTVPDSREEEMDLKAEKGKLPEWLLHEPLLDIDQGLINSEGAAFYQKSMEIFLAHVEDNVSALESCFAAGDFENYTIKAHGLKSTSRIIGALVLSYTAAAMERAGDDKNYDYIRQEHSGFIALYRKYQHILTGHQNEGANETISSEDLEDAIMALKEYALAEDYTLVESALSTLQGYHLDSKTADMVTEIKAGLNRLDWDAIRGTLGV